MQGNKHPVDGIGCFLTRLGYPRVAARFIGQLGQSGISGGEHLVIEAPQQVGAPLGEIHDPRSQPGRMKGQAQRVDGRDEEFRRNAGEKHSGTRVACNNVPLAVDHEGRIGIMAGEQPLNGIPDVSHVRAVIS